jgi:hypothetical protein
MSTSFFDIHGNLLAVRRASIKGAVLELRVSIDEWESCSDAVHWDDPDGLFVSRAEAAQKTTIIPMTPSRLREEARELNQWLKEHNDWHEVIPMVKETRNLIVQKADELVKLSLKLIKT